MAYLQRISRFLFGGLDWWLGFGFEGLVLEGKWERPLLVH